MSFKIAVIFSHQTTAGEEGGTSLSLNLILKYHCPLINLARHYSSWPNDT